MEHSEKGREVTDWVSVWLVNDSDTYFGALDAARCGDLETLESFVVETLKGAPEHSGAWYTAQELSANDYERIDWQDIADTLTAE